MNGRAPNKDEGRWLSNVAQIPCIVCTTFYDVQTPAEVHHMKGQRAKDAHLKSIPLCTRHHRHKDNHKPARWISRHGDGKAAFEEEYFREVHLLRLTKREINRLQEHCV